MSHPDISIVIPFFNEKEGIKHLVTSVNDTFGRQPFETEVIFVDDGSVDGSVEVLKAQQFSFSSARVICLKRNFGSHAALRAGFIEARGEFTASLSADLQDPPEILLKMREKAKEGFDVVFAERSEGSEGFFSKAYSFLMRTFAFPDYPKNGFDVALFDADIRERLNQNSRSRASVFLDILGLPSKKAFLLYDKKRRTAGHSKWTLSKKIRLFTDSVLRYTRIPQYLLAACLLWVALSLFVKDPGAIRFSTAAFLASFYIYIQKMILSQKSASEPFVISQIITLQ